MGGQRRSLRRDDMCSETLIMRKHQPHEDLGKGGTTGAKVLGLENLGSY